MCFKETAFVGRTVVSAAYVDVITATRCIPAVVKARVPGLFSYRKVVFCLHCYVFDCKCSNILYKKGKRLLLCAACVLKQY